LSSFIPYVRSFCGETSTQESDVAIYTVLEPPLKRPEARRGPERFAFVRDSFHFWAFVLAPLWMLWHRLWLVFIGFALIAIALQFGLHALGVGSGGRLLGYALLALLVGLEAGALRRWTMTRRGWRDVGIVSGETREAAERRFFDTWTGAAGEPGPQPVESFLAPARAALAARQPNRPSDIVGLFPEPGAPR
jgi:Protein of unknown function (DUF2628)